MYRVLRITLFIVDLVIVYAREGAYGRRFGRLRDDMRACAVIGRTSPLPPVGKGRGASHLALARRSLLAPAPNPSPQGGREAFRHSSTCAPRQSPLRVLR